MTITPDQIAAATAAIEATQARVTEQTNLIACEQAALVATTELLTQVSQPGVTIATIASNMSEYDAARKAQEAFDLVLAQQKQAAQDATAAAAEVEAAAVTLTEWQIKAHVVRAVMRSYLVEREGPLTRGSEGGRQAKRECAQTLIVMF